MQSEFAVLRVSRWVQRTRWCCAVARASSSESLIRLRGRFSTGVYSTFQFGNTLSFPSNHWNSLGWPHICWLHVSRVTFHNEYLLHGKRERGNALREHIINFPACSNKHPLRWPGQGLHRALATSNRQAIDLLVLKSEVMLLMCWIVESVEHEPQWCKTAVPSSCVQRAYGQNSINLLEVKFLHPNHLQPGIVNICMWFLVYAAITHVYKINKSFLFSSWHPKRRAFRSRETLSGNRKTTLSHCSAAE